MQSDEMTSISSQHRAILRNGESKDIRVGNFLSSLARFLSRYNIMAKLSKLFDNRPGKTFIGIESSHTR